MYESESGIDVAFAPSWIDRLVRWIEQLPGPIWLFYVLGVLGTALLINVVLWIDGSVPFLSNGSIPGIFPPFVFYFLALYHYLTRIGSHSLAAFRPLMDVNDAEFTQVDYQLATLPSWIGWLTIVIALATTPAYFLTGQVFGDRLPQTALPYIIVFILAAFFQVTLVCLLIRSFRQLRMVHKLHAQVTNVNLLKLGPAHALSGLTARTGIGLILLFILGYFYNPSVFSGNWLVAAYNMFAVPAVVVFVVPVMGMRDRLEKEKRHVLNEMSHLLHATSEILESKIRERDYNHLQGMDTAIRALIRKREMLEKISTWPWDPSTIRGFASTLLLPIFLWLVTRFLEGFL
jgi:sterol desaturase/sphingolipid hydroxylase (fatty acid hydroxylase superfamily)